MTTVRPAGYNERRCIARDINGLYGWVVTIGRYTPPKPLQAEQWRQVLTRAVSDCVNIHPALSCCVKDSGHARPSIVKLDEIDVRAHMTLDDTTVRADEDSDLTNLLEQVHAQPFDRYESRPQWRIWSLPVAAKNQTTAYYVAFAASHVLVDGMSSKIFHQTLDDALSQRLQTSTSTSLLGALDQSAKMPISWSFLLKPLLQELLPGFVARVFGLSKDVAFWHGAEQKPDVSSRKLIKTAVKVLRYEAPALAQVLAACKLHSCRLTALLNLLIAQSLAHLLQGEGQRHASFKTSTPYDLRRLISGSAGHMANYSSAVDQELQVDCRPPRQLTEEQWTSVSKETDLLQKRSNTLSDQPVALLKYLSDFNDWVKKKATTPAAESFSVSNLGNYTPPDPSATWLSQFVFSQSADATGAPININVASINGGPLNIVLTWWPGMLSVQDEAAFMDSLCADLSARLDAVAKT